MSRTASASTGKNRPSPLSSKSFARYEPSTTSSRDRASTIASPVSVKSPLHNGPSKEDVFEKPEEDEDEPISPSITKSTSLPDKFDELPIELASLTDRFIDSLSAKVFTEPPTIDQLADIFQEFYIKASGSISTHISALMLRMNRDASPSSKSKVTAAKKGADSLAPPERASGSQQMLTANEVTEKRKARRMLEYKRLLLEEAVERRACEKIYKKIWRHKSTLDEVRDEKLRSKTAALALVGIGLRDLGIEMNEKSETTAEDLQESLVPAREGLAKMNDEHYPLGKLQHLTTAHKAIVDTLSAIKPSSSSADEILPTLIYTLITSPVEGINIISNLNFIQRFRTASKIDGEAAYCLTNLEAAISFLENVELASLRADERPEGPDKPPSMETPSDDRPEPFPRFPSDGPSISTSEPLTSTTTSSASGTPAEPSRKPSLAIQKPPAPRHQRTLSDLLQPISNAPGAVRTSAEESLKNISTTLDNSFKVLFGKLRERGNENSSAEVVVPKTLDEARQLVSRPLTPPDADDTAISETSSIAGDSSHTPPNRLSATEEKVLGLFGGRRRTASLIRDRSADSQRSTTSSTTKDAAAGSRKVAFAATGSATDLSKAAAPTNAPLMNPLDSVKTFGQSININPLNNISSAFGGAFRSFGRQPSSNANPSSPRTEKSNPFAIRSASATTAPASPGIPMPEPTAEQISLRAPSRGETAHIRAEPPKARFVNAADADELKISEVDELLKDYQRLAKILDGLRIVGEEEAEAEAEPTAS
ncbi:Vacuolar protein sorting-associated protein 9b [Cyphellophora attinorum]|uniref:Vacuolar protein sorting-associated protein 9b n=1 Tax=Cyphellophora attinorum TaxID=1664694 RepID=A0A0N1HAN9_9EURO|nr:Vacuolar protein sorting-associated protein 9b [Phialophora attinorum]KPI41105.1 Vacuolar protein sorting-associated protein 9b [Phialophora attinorum]